jgi:hypothetical protein
MNEGVAKPTSNISDEKSRFSYDIGKAVWSETLSTSTVQVQLAPTNRKTRKVNKNEAEESAVNNTLEMQLLPTPQ